jgi:hypothetical protein
MSKYEKLKSYLQTHYNFHASLGQFNLGDHEQYETEAKWRMISDIMDYIDNLDSSETKDEEFDFSILGDYMYYENQTAVFAADSVPLNFYGTGSDVISFDVG